MKRAADGELVVKEPADCVSSAVITTSDEPGEPPMSLLTIEGTYRDGRIELSEHPGGVEEGIPVLVTFLPGKRRGPTPETDPGREELRQRAFARMEEGLHLGGPPYRRREDLYDRFDR